MCLVNNSSIFIRSTWATCQCVRNAHLEKASPLPFASSTKNTEGIAHHNAQIKKDKNVARNVKMDNVNMGIITSTDCSVCTLILPSKSVLLIQICTESIKTKPSALSTTDIFYTNPADKTFVSIDFLSDRKGFTDRVPSYSSLLTLPQILSR